MTIEFTYLFDPLCGWCYGASPVVQELGQHPQVQMALLPTGLFNTPGRTMDAHFADYAWANDQRIHQLTGQPFSDAYRRQILGPQGSAFDSTAATLALTAVGLEAPAAELSVLKRLQEARFVQGQDVCDISLVGQLLSDLGQTAAAQRLLDKDPALDLALRSRTQKGRQLLHALGTEGVPTLAVRSTTGWRMLDRSLLYANVERILAHAATA